MEKKTKLTISVGSKKSFKNFDTQKTQGKKTVIIGKQSGKPGVKGGFNKPGSFKSSAPKTKFTGNFKPNFSSKVTHVSSDFERRKLAEQRATKRLKAELDNDKKTKQGNK